MLGGILNTGGQYKYNQVASIRGLAYRSQLIGKLRQTLGAVVQLNAAIMVRNADVRGMIAKIAYRSET